MISPQTIDIQHLRHLWESQLSISCAPQVLMASLAARVMLPWENLIRWCHVGTSEVQQKCQEMGAMSLQITDVNVKLGDLGILNELSTCNPFADFLDDNFRSYPIVYQRLNYIHSLPQGPWSRRSHRNICSTKNLFKQPSQISLASQISCKKWYTLWPSGKLT
jgi:hypothetical protein